MIKLDSLKNFKLVEGEPNFLIGIAGNGISTLIQREIFIEDPKDVYYLNYINP